MRQIGEMTSMVRLFRRHPVTENGLGRDVWELLGSYPAEVYKQSDRAFAQGDARYSESILFVTMRRPLACCLTEGLRLDLRGKSHRVVEVVDHMPKKGFVRLRCVHVDMEGNGSVEC